MSAASTSRSWGNYPQVRQEAIVSMRWRHEELPSGRPLLAVGRRLSYGDSCLNEDGTVVETSRLDRFLAFDREAGVLRCEAGVSLEDLIALTVPAGWFPPVVPGTAKVSVGGALANDVHGKNHHVAGTFGEHVLRFELATSDGTRRVCSRTQDADLFAATVGGLGLTGLVTWVEMRLRRIAGPWMDTEAVRFRGIEEFLALSDASATTHEHTAAWIDAAAPKAMSGRGVFLRGNFANDPAPSSNPAARLSVPVALPGFVLNGAAIRAFNALYRSRAKPGPQRQTYRQFLFPLDAVDRWNKVYGTRGFLQHQSVVPRREALAAVRAMLDAIDHAREPSTLAVIKAFGERPAPGILSFARPGVTTAFDFPIRGRSTFDLLDQLDRIATEAGGAIYPAKDARMSPATFAAGFPRWRELEALRDPAFSSSFWRRVTAPR